MPKKIIHNPNRDYEKLDPNYVMMISSMFLNTILGIFETMRTKRLSITMLIAVLTLSLALPTAAIASPNENANNNALDNSKFEIPKNAVQIAPGIYSLGTAQVDGKTVEGIMALHHRDGHTGGPGGGEDTTSSCFSYIGGRAVPWTSVEPWVVNPTNSFGISDNDVKTILSDSIQKWEDESSSDILGDGTIVNTPLAADTASPDGVNEVYFGNIVDENVIAVTIVWGVFNGPPFAKALTEWDQIYDSDGDWNWATNEDLNSMDFENVATHELGHSVGMGHAGDTCEEETMFWATSNGDISRRSLHTGDIAGIQQLY